MATQKAKKTSSTPKTIKFKFYGLGGQGIKTLASSLGRILCDYEKMNVTVIADYDTIVRGSNIKSDLIVSEGKINTPEVAIADYCVIFSLPDSYVAANKYIADEGFKEQLETEGLSTKGKTEYFAINKTASAIGSPLYQNTVMLGILLRELGLDVTKLDLKKYLPETHLEENLKAVLGI
jgi:Pyruvate/2-oxoacid:ferredoxin oxidoreductase gamma subunit